MRAKVTLPKSMSWRKFGTCRWCGLQILGRDGNINKRRLWHPECSAIYMIATRPRFARKALRKRDKKICAVCGVKCNSTDKPWEADHILPLWKSGGKHEFFDLSNLQTLCVPHHNDKTVIDMIEYRKSR